MKKSVIKRRKRVVPAAQGSQLSGIDVANNSVGSPESDRASPPSETRDLRGSMNPDGSVNLGFRRRNEHARAMLPEPSMARNGQQQLPTSDLIAYASTSSNQAPLPENLDSLSNDNRLPPMTSYPSPVQRRPSLSPNSFLSPSRKRSFSAAEIDPRPHLSEVGNTSSSAHPKRLSSIKSILNPGFSDSDSSDMRGIDRQSPGRYPAIGSIGSPSMSSGYATSPANSGVGSALSSGRDAQSESDKSKLERREMLQREAEHMREALKAKERELEELGINQ